MKKIVATVLTPIAFGLLCGAAQAADIVRHKIPNSDFPIALAVTIPPTATIHFISGQVPAVVNKEAAGDSLAAFGDTKTQTETVLKKIKEILEGMKLQMSDVVKMQVFLVGDPAKGGKADTKGFMEGYTQYFGGAQPNLPARAVVQVAGLSNPGWLVEIEVVAAKK
ncbi:UNVERIFIED_ORG: enamine deaminase RidA (YjgF/YER057c/UK114 family) [Zoogloea ramigera]|uniref:RidA family protein n=1 Tax=Duganella zoogloeoides TaxID=75659 RepID=A0ABZ0XXV5_9BURK|nr:RidA family protein [Duganella zoogloeoides]WQH03950.1 RidA family protein [Duganella zoogloeoides]